MQADRNEIPLPVSFYQQKDHISRTTIWRWEQLGLRILHVGGKRFIRPSDWAAFMEQQHSKATEGSK
jgi:hypothetical protein